MKNSQKTQFLYPEYENITNKTHAQNAKNNKLLLDIENPLAYGYL